MNTLLYDDGEEFEFIDSVFDFRFDSEHGINELVRKHSKENGDGSQNGYDICVMMKDDCE